MRSFKVENGLNLTREIKSMFILANGKVFFLSQSKTMIFRVLETKNILTEACFKQIFLVAKTYFTFH